MPETLPAPRARRHRAGRALFALVALTAVLVACGSDDPAALDVGSTSVSESTVDEQLTAIAKNKVIAAQAATDGKIKPDVAARWLTALVEMEVAKAAVDKTGTKPTSEDSADAFNWAQEFFGSTEAFDEFPGWFKAVLLRGRGYVAAYVRTNTPKPTETTMRTAYDSSLGRNCASRRYVWRIVTANEQAAQAAAAEVANGADFATVAGRVSTDAESASRGGAMGCLDGQQVDAAVTSAASSTALGQVSAPFSTAEGWQILKVEDVSTALPYDEVKSEIRAELQYGDAGRKKLAQTVAGAKVTVAPRFGRWVVEQGRGRVEPPGSSTTTTSRAADSSTTTTGP